MNSTSPSGNVAGSSFVMSISIMTALAWALPLLRASSPVIARSFQPLEQLSVLRDQGVGGFLHGLPVPRLRQDDKPWELDDPESKGRWLRSGRAVQLQWLHIPPITVLFVLTGRVLDDDG